MFRQTTLYCIRVIIRRMYFHAFNFRTSQALRIYFNNKIFVIYGIVNLLGKVLGHTIMFDCIVAISILLLITGAVQTLPSQRPRIVTMPGLTTGRASGSRHAPLPGEEEGREGMTRKKWAESSSKPTRREKSGRKNKRLEVIYCQV